MTTTTSKLRQIGEAVLTGFGLLSKLRDGMRSKRQEETPTMAAQQVLSAALERRLRQRLKERKRTGTWADRARRTQMAGPLNAAVGEDMRLANRDDHGEYSEDSKRQERERAFGQEEHPMPRRREAILATKAKLKRKAEEGSCE
jgi:hypothetical protein